MVQILLCRHSKSEPHDGPKPDRDRELTDRGRADAEAIGREIARRALSPDLVLASDSIRARQTTDLIVSQVSSRPDIIYLPELYSATGSDILDTIATYAGGYRRSLVVGHNPGMEELASRLAKREIELGTSGVVVLEADNWETSSSMPLATAHVTDVFGPHDRA